MLDLELVAADLGECAPVKRVGEQRRAVGGEPDCRAAGTTAACDLGEVIRHASQHVALLTTQVALQLDDGGAPGHVDAPAVVDEIALMLQFAERGAEALPQQFSHQTAQRLVSRPGRHRTDDVGQAISAPAVCHFSPSPGACTVAAA